MTITGLKPGKPESEPQLDDARVRAIVKGILKDIETRGDAVVGELSANFDGAAPERFRSGASEIEAPMAKVPDREMADNRFARDQIRFVGHAEQCNVRVRRYGRQIIAYSAAAPVMQTVC